MAPVIDQAVTWRKVEERLATESDPVLRRNLETILAHMKSESAGDIDGLLDTLADNVPVFVRDAELRAGLLQPREQRE